MYKGSKYYGFLYHSRGGEVNYWRVDYLFNLFFDFYTLITLDYFLGSSGKIIQSSYKSRVITETFHRKTESLYQNLKSDLFYSCRKEADSHCNHEFHSAKERSIYLRSQRLAPDLVRLFSVEKWEDQYGGPLWAKGASFLLEEPKDKPRWIDEVMDLEHNNGFILNKTDFVFLEKRRVFFSKGKPLNALDYRANAALGGLHKFCSPEVQNIVTANKALIPAGLW